MRLFCRGGRKEGGEVLAQTQAQLVDANLEKYVLAGIIEDPSLIAEIKISEKCFSEERNRQIYGIIMQLEAEGQPVDVFQILLKNNDHGLEMHIRKISELITTSKRIIKAADKLREMATRRELLSACSRISAAAKDDISVGELTNLAEQTILSATQEGLQSVDWYDTYQLSEIYDDYREEKASQDGIIGISTGIPKLDQITGGLSSSKLTYLGGRPGMGKTFLAINIALNAAELGKKVMFFSIEMEKREITERMISHLGRISTDELRDGLSAEGPLYDKYFNALNKLQVLPLKLNDQAGIAVDDIASIARRAKRKDGLDLVVIDYFQKISYKRQPGMNTDDVVKDVSLPLAELAKNLDIHVLCLSQLSREVERRNNKRPINSDLRESGNLEQDADMILFLYRHSEYYPELCEREGIGHIAELKVSKNRFGRQGTILLDFEAPMSTFNEAGYHDYDQYRRIIGTDE